MKEYPLKQLQNEENFAPEVNKLMLSNIGINPFAVELLNESLRCHPDFEEITEEKPFRFTYRGVLMQFSFDPPSSVIEERERLRQNLPARNSHYFKKE